MEAAMPLIYVPLILYASWMEFMTHPFAVPSASPSADDGDVDAFAIRTGE